MRYDTIIIGAGPAGLAAGIRMAMYGGKTLILERHSRVGGLNSWYMAGGYYMDSGLHAITNYAPDGPASAPIKKLLRQLRLRMEDLKLCPQRTSRISFPGASLAFSNDFDLLTQSVNQVFPYQKDNFQKLAGLVRNTDPTLPGWSPRSGRKAVRAIVTDHLLEDMLFLPLMYYGCPDEEDMEFGQFVIMFKSIFLEGLARPEGGIKILLDLLTAAYAKAGGELRLETGVSGIKVDNGRVAGVVTGGGEQIECSRVLSSIGYPETVAICPKAAVGGSAPAPGEMSFMETALVLDKSPDDLGEHDSIIFYNNKPSFNYRRPEAPVDITSGVICFPGNFSYAKRFEPPMVRITNLANHWYWSRFVDEGEYHEAKAHWSGESLRNLSSVTGDFSGNVIFSDVFTPRTIRRYTGRMNGAVYGSPLKLRDGVMAIDGLYLCGTDQGFLGVTGALLSGITVANSRLVEV
ncbi:MAG: NAD(P)/FAD-dependent oxidoreductase [Nitrospinae bacterium]|nr:NAD(P)/FAD-dependent oxidoreductase [Nitrospinota bacterium]